MNNSFAQTNVLIEMEDIKTKVLNNFANGTNDLPSGDTKVFKTR